MVLVYDFDNGLVRKHCFHNRTNSTVRILGFCLLLEESPYMKMGLIPTDDYSFCLNRLHAPVSDISLQQGDEAE